MRSLYPCLQDVYKYASVWTNHNGRKQKYERKQWRRQEVINHLCRHNISEGTWPKGRINCRLYGDMLIRRRRSTAQLLSCRMQMKTLDEDATPAEVERGGVGGWGGGGVRHPESHGVTTWRGWREETAKTKEEKDMKVEAAVRLEGRGDREQVRRSEARRR